MKARPRGAIGSRRAARENAVELAYEREIRGITVDDLLTALPVPPDDFTVTLLRLAEARQEQSDALIRATSEHWDLERMAVMDRTLLRQAVAELLDGTTPPGVVISEAVWLTELFSTEESSRFVNGILGAIAKRLDGAGSAGQQTPTPEPGDH